MFNTVSAFSTFTKLKGMDAAAHGSGSGHGEATSSHTIGMLNENEHSAEDKKKRLRSIEKSRASTCRFADLVAERVIQIYRNLAIEDETVNEALRGQLAQTCVSAMVMVEKESLVVCSLGIGTKIVPEDIARSDANGRRVYDSHAEVLARRGFIRFLYAQIRAWRSGVSSIFDSDSIPLTVRSGITFHLYCSSAPCGNACVRRWAKGLSETYHEELGNFEWPDQAHARFLLHSPLQVAVLCKVKAASMGGTSEEIHQDEMPSSKHEPLEIPPGTALPSWSQASSRATCSDKVARWCAVGIEGALLSSLLKTSIRLSTVIVGRKFSRLHLERAICCRLMSFWHKDEPHPASLCTSVKLHEGGLAQEDKARFHDFALVWALEWDQQKTAEILRPSEGLPLRTQGSEMVVSSDRSIVSRSALFELFLMEVKTVMPKDLAVSHCSEFTQELYTTTKRQVESERHKAKLDLLFTKHLKPWPRYRFKQE